MNFIKHEAVAASVVFCVIMSLGCSAVQAQTDDSDNIIKIGYADIRFHTQSGELHGAPGTTPPDVTAKVRDSRTMAIVYERRLFGPWSFVYQTGLPPTVSLQGEGVAKPLGRVATAKVWFPAALIKYDLPDVFGFRPYVAAGANYTWYTDKHIADSYNKGFGGADSSLRLKNGWGGVAKLGVEYPIDEKWSVDFFYTKYWIKTEGTISTDTPGVGNIDRKINIKADPSAFALLIGYRF